MIIRYVHKLHKTVLVQDKDNPTIYQKQDIVQLLPIHKDIERLSNKILDIKGYKYVVSNRYGNEIINYYEPINL